MVHSANPSGRAVPSGMHSGGRTTTVFSAILTTTYADNVPVDVKAQTDGSYSFSNVSINSSSNYSVVLGGVDDYEVTEKLNKAAGDYTDVKIAATQRAKVNVSGKFVTSDDKASDVTKITFTNKSDSSYS